MANKPEIQYVRQFYVYGSEVQKREQNVRKPKFRLPQILPERLQKIYIDPVALVGVLVSAVMLVLMVTGALNMRGTRAQYEQLSARVADLQRENAALSHAYHTSYDPEKIRVAAKKMGMIDAEEAERFTVFFTVPEPEKEPTAWDNFIWLISGLLDNPKRS